VHEHSLILTTKKSSPILRELRRVVRKIYYFKFVMKKDTLIARKQDTRDKIMMGGLVAKAGLADLHKTNPEVILGMLIEAKDKMLYPVNFAKWRELGLKEMGKK
jgi:hypothetical protein